MRLFKPRETTSKVNVGSAGEEERDATWALRVWKKGKRSCSCFTATFTAPLPFSAAQVQFQFPTGSNMEHFWPQRSENWNFILCHLGNWLEQLLLSFGGSRHT